MRPPADPDCALPAPGHERRDFLRRKLTEILEIDWGSSKLKAVVRDIAPGGLFVELVPPLWLGARFSARLCVRPPLLLNCTVCRVEPSTGNAVRFDPMEDTGQRQLQQLLADLPDI